MVNTVIKQLSYRDIRAAKRSSIKARNKRNINELTKNFFLRRMNLCLCGTNFGKKIYHRGYK